MDVSNITMQDYSVKIDGLPHTASDPAEIGVMFAKYGRVYEAGGGGREKQASSTMAWKAHTAPVSIEF